ncbi:hypothetical protein [Neisseria wadsworthii]|nr:hypothetical protein [Neisseria wadsworthii]
MTARRQSRRNACLKTSRAGIPARRLTTQTQRQSDKATNNACLKTN